MTMPLPHHAAALLCACGLLTVVGASAAGVATTRSPAGPADRSGPAVWGLTGYGPAVLCQGANTANVTLRALRTGPCPAGSRAVRIATVNIFDQLYVGSSLMNTSPAAYPDALAALESAAASGVRVFRFFGSLFGDATKAWLTNTTVYWSEYDRLVDDIERLGMQAIPSLGTDQWHEVANAVTPGLNETLNDGVRNRSSVSYRLQARYFAEVVERYSSRRGILAWELGNELNLRVSLPPPSCGPQQCFNTADMVRYTKDLVAIIRATDPIRPISSGFSMPRAQAWHQEHCPISGPCPADPNSSYWGTDSQAQFKQMLALQNDAVDLWSVHTYDNPSDCYFGKTPATCVFNASVAAIAAAHAASLQRVLFVGEYGGPNPDFTGPTPADQEFPASILATQVDAAGPVKDGMLLTALWAWACPSHRGDMVCIYPNSTVPKEAGSERMLGLLTKANAALQKQAYEA